MKKYLIMMGLIVLIILISIYSYILLDDKIKDDEKIISSYNNPKIPEGFSTVDTETAKWIEENGIIQGWNQGLVIEDSMGNQFVWVPVNEKIIEYSNKKIKDELNYDLSMLYHNNEDENQVLRYGGFYISRYEAGVPDEIQNRTSNISKETNDILGIPVSKSGIIPWNYISLKNAKLNAESMYNTKQISSGLPTLRQIQYIMAWLDKDGYDVYKDSSNFGNYSNVNFEFSGLYSEDYGKNYRYGRNVTKNENNIILSTGITERNKTKNIYDLAGNLWEYTNDYLEINENEIMGYYCTGGHYDNTGNNYPAYSFNLKNVSPIDKVGYRVVLFFK